MSDKSTKILIVEDQQIVSSNISILLKHRGYSIAGIAINGESALEMVESQTPDLVLMDIMLPGKLDGIDTADIIMKRWNIPVIYLSAKTDKEILDRAIQTVPYGYITKDISLKEQLPLMIDFAVYKHRVIKEKEASEIALRDSEEKFRSIAASVKDAIVFLDNSGRISFWNQAAEQIFGWKEEEILGLELYNVISPVHYRDYYKKGFSDYSANGKGDFIGRNIEIEAITKSQSIFPMELALTSVKLKDKWCACGVMRDITIRKSTEEELERLIEEIQISREVIEQHANDLISLNNEIIQSEERLQELNASKDKFFSIISHDLKNPLQGLVGYSEILAKELGNLNGEEIREIVDDLHNSSQNIYKLLENLLEWSRIQRGIITYTPESVNLYRIAKVNADLQKINSESKQIAIALEIPEKLTLYADANMLNTIIRNLLSNAVKFTRLGGRIVISAEEKDNGMAELTVEDNGVGIEPDVIENLFRIDMHHTTPGTSNEKGTGLGLVLCKDLSEKNNGSIRVESNPGTGTKFIVTIPLYNNQ